MKKKLPDKLLVIISRKFAGNVWVLHELLKHFLEELQAEESCMPQSKKSRCVYCLGEDNPPSRCSKVMNINSRRGFQKIAEMFYTAFPFALKTSTRMKTTLLLMWVCLWGFIPNFQIFSILKVMKN